MITANFNNWTEESYTADQFAGDNIYDHVEPEWEIVGDQSSVTQNNDCLPGFFYSDFNTFNNIIEVEVSTGTRDDDFFGFALNFQPGDTTNSSPDILIVDWTGKDLGGDRTSYLQLSHITEEESFLGFTHLPSIAEAITLSSTPWEKDTTYKFKFFCTETNLKVWVDETLEFDVTGTFTDGRFAFYALSQPGVTFSNVESQFSGTILAPGNWGIVSQTKYQPSDLKLTDYFGQSVAISGLWAIIGADQVDAVATNAGAAYLFQWDGGTWQQKQRLLPISISGTPSIYSHFGWSVDMDGEWAIVGAYHQDTTGVKQGGAVYLFKLEGETWQPKQEPLLHSERKVNDHFGWSVAISGNYAVIGCKGNDGQYSNVGAAYIYELQGEEWKEPQKIQSSQPKENDYFGTAVAISENWAMISGTADGGSVHVFKWIDGNWIFQEKLQPPDIQARDEFGCSLAISGNKVIVGSQGRDNEGCAYIFELTGETWHFQSQIKANDTVTKDKFGCSVALSGDVAIIGAENADRSVGEDGEDTLDDSGKAYIFKYLDGDWQEQSEKLDPSDYGNESALFGISVAISGKLAMVGATGADEKLGAVYGFESRD
ncbi:hypothetical protein [Crocosphaera sp.]|uniref:hypothetical protein n=1 Tax=Crocosphaera sp. TaxID=2729996 RepID=UPI003F20F7FE|nr:hypothetical protein [Crocosphaera sp.]